MLEANQFELFEKVELEQVMLTECRATERQVAAYESKRVRDKLQSGTHRTYGNCSAWGFTGVEVSVWDKTQISLSEERIVHENAKTANSVRSKRVWRTASSASLGLQKQVG